MGNGRVRSAKQHAVPHVLLHPERENAGGSPKNMFTALSGVELPATSADSKDAKHSGMLRPRLR